MMSKAVASPRVLACVGPRAGLFSCLCSIPYLGVRPGYLAKLHVASGFPVCKLPVECSLPVFLLFSCPHPLHICNNTLTHRLSLSPFCHAWQEHMTACILFCAAEYLKANPATHLAYGAQWSSSTQWNCFNCKVSFFKTAGPVVLVSATINQRKSGRW